MTVETLLLRDLVKAKGDWVRVEIERYRYKDGRVAWTLWTFYEGKTRRTHAYRYYDYQKASTHAKRYIKTKLSQGWKMYKKEKAA